MRRILFVGLGHMGLPMACNLMRGGFEVLGFDLNPKAQAQWEAAGGALAQSLADASTCDGCITMLQTGEQVQAVCLGANAPNSGIFEHLKPGSFFIDCSSIDVAHSRALFDAAKKRKLMALDAPVSGGMLGAQNGTLTLMVGGEADDYEALKPVLSAMGERLFHAGAAGCGQIAKICNNMILGVSMSVVSEAFLIANELGLAPQTFYQIVNAASGQCWVTQQYVPMPNVLPQVPANHDYEPGFSAAMMLKDLRLSQEAAKHAKLDAPMSAMATALYEQLADSGLEAKDFSVILQWLKGRKRCQKTTKK